MSHVTGANSVRMTRGSTANKRAGTVQNTLAKRGPSVPQRLLGDLAAAANGLKNIDLEHNLVATRGRAFVCSGKTSVAARVRGQSAEQGLGKAWAWRGPLRCGVLFGCVPFDAKRDAGVFLGALGQDERGILLAVAASLPCNVQQLAHCMVCVLHWLAGSRHA